ncbi:endonuclease/exonuclease/phosphatase family protein [Flavihumibacter petaseus]|uniref:Endonuclease/exonuclease/phosphatase domain-containing protein n=1 Tax=Flavihumibacter petaseus NBRC 106054 TaxID=1220578 RepID=A0A0E9MXW7_9BACT|nr:endonuclease/exonuclease/phosphatase family protein [Flavihumibacter petaseus]GAO42358.1 hypothetical protein FPE01S_01_13720 [Flavihumibacter petaseus NBRC 106054]
MISPGVSGLAVSLISLFLLNEQPSRVPEAKKHDITVMTYNIHHGNPPGKPGTIDLDAIAKVIKKSDADVVAIQEVDIKTGRSGHINEAAELAEKAGYTSFYFGKAMDYDGGSYGVLLMAKVPLFDMRTLLLPLDTANPSEPRVLATGKVSIDGRQVTIGCTHLDAGETDAVRQLQINAINKFAATVEGPFIIAGDFNASEKSPVIRSLDSLFTRTCQNCPQTLLEDGNFFAIDFIAFKGKSDFIIKEHKVIPEKKASDHMPVRARLEFH